MPRRGGGLIGGSIGNHHSADMSHEPTENRAFLLAKVRAGDDEARVILITRCLVLLKRWARGRIRYRAVLEMPRS